MRVCVIGSGLSALTLAKALVNLNIFVDVDKQNKKEKINRSRTIGISKSNLKYFNKNIINIEKKIWNLKKIEIYSENLKNEKMLKFENNKDQLFSIVKNYQIHDLLNENLRNNKYFKIIKLNKKLIASNKYDLIINTDYKSNFTKKFFNKKIIKSYNSLAYTTIIKHKKIINDSAIQIFTKNGPLAFLPISNERTSIVFSIHNSKKNKIENINKLIRHYNFKYNIKKIDKVECFDLISFNLRSYYHKNLLAFGDLLHRIHPLAGQGFNMTIRDIKSLLDIIMKKLDLGLPLDSSLNVEFEKKIKHKNFLFSNGIDLIHEFFNFERKLKNNILSKSIKVLSNNSSINKFFTNVADRGILF